VPGFLELGGELIQHVHDAFMVPPGGRVQDVVGGGVRFGDQVAGDRAVHLGDLGHHPVVVGEFPHDLVWVDVAILAAEERAPEVPPGPHVVRQRLPADPGSVRAVIGQDVVVVDAPHMASAAAVAVPGAGFPYWRPVVAACRLERFGRRGGRGGSMHG
jgi:hypothetical protein